MSVSIELPEDVSLALEAEWGDVPRRTLEALAAEGYRSGVLTESHLRRMLGFETRIQVHEFLRRAGVSLQYSEEDLDHDIETHRRLGLLPAA
jgi:hypothetical protein